MQTTKFDQDYKFAKELFESYLGDYLENLSDIPEPVLSGIKYALLGGGKRLRPCLAILTAKMFGSSVEKVLPVSLAIEMIHTYSLVHDDLPCMDDDDLRRGQPTVHKKFGEGMAVLIGDALLNLSIEVLASCSEQLGKDFAKIVSVIYLNSGAKGMIAGQCVDLESENGAKPTEEGVKYLHLHKTACLIKAPIVCSAILAGAKNEEIKALEVFSDNLGLAFQITDDVLDVVGDTETLGKTVGSDENNGKMTYPAVFGLEGAKELALIHIGLAKGALEGFNNSENLVKLADSIQNRRK